ncbi:carboxypeptidase M32 [Patescibacteria group bacterium]|nr:carboxypeptidase M32 [Patescibacteria group bacterium]MBU0964380.1 carboxypeptidase M32 [Patescibacteria group bacterium]
MSTQEFDKLIELLQPANQKGSIAARLHFDDQTGSPPDEEAKKQLAQLMALAEREAHELFTADSISQALTGRTGLSLTEQRMVDRLQLSHDMAKRIPPEFVQKQREHIQAANRVWIEARQKSDFTLFQNTFTKSVELAREEAIMLGADSGRPETYYPALLPIYEPGMDFARLREIIEAVQGPTVDLLGRITSSGKEFTDKLWRGYFEIDRQKSLGQTAAWLMGYDFKRGILKVTVHPFMSTVGLNDCRITTRYDPTYLPQALGGVMHEAGHGLYEQNVAEAIRRFITVPLVHSHGIHESSSLLWECFVGRSKPFLQFFHPILTALFEQYRDVSVDELYQAINRVMPSFIRVEADELTYNLHIILRFGMEPEILAGNIKPEDVPAEWNRRFKELFGIAVDTDANGCLQDIHWSHGYFGYFPTYLLGKLGAAQLFAAFVKAVPSWQEQFRMGNFRVLLDWLCKNVYPYGHVSAMDDLMVKATGEKLNPKYWFDHLEEKFGQLYGLN